MGTRWLINIVANVSNRPQSEISLNSRSPILVLTALVRRTGGGDRKRRRVNYCAGTFERSAGSKRTCERSSRRPGAAAGRDGSSGRSEARRNR